MLSILFSNKPKTIKCHQNANGTLPQLNKFKQLANKTFSIICITFNFTDRTKELKLVIDTTTIKVKMRLV